LSMPQTIPSLIPMSRTTSRIVIIFRRFHHHPREALCVVASRNDVREHSVEHTLAFLAFQSGCFHTQRGPIHTDSKFVTNAIDLTAMNHAPVSAPWASMARGRQGHLQMKNTFFSPTSHCFVASNTHRPLQFLTGHLVSPGETDLDSAHQPRYRLFIKPTPSTFGVRALHSAQNHKNQCTPSCGGASFTLYQITRRSRVLASVRPVICHVSQRLSGSIITDRSPPHVVFVG
jgi:hypothetical protein